MSKFVKCAVIGIFGLALGFASTGCQNSAAQSKAEKASFYGTPPTPAMQAQIKAQQDAQAKAMAAATKSKQ